MGRRAFGQVRRLPSGRYQARYQVDALGHVANAPTTFTTKAAAEAWLRREAVRLEGVAAGVPQPAAVGRSPDVRRVLSSVASGASIAGLDRAVLPAVSRQARPCGAGFTAVGRDPPEVIRAWHAGLAPDAPTVRARTYALTKTILGSALAEDLIGAQPCRIRGASNARVATEVMIATPEQVDALHRAMPPRLALAVLFGAWCQLRVGETLALRRRDVDTAAGVVHVRRGVTWQGRTPTFGPPKTRAGERAVHFPEAMGPAVREHLDQARRSQAGRSPLPRRARRAATGALVDVLHGRVQGRRAQDRPARDVPLPSPTAHRRDAPRPAWGDDRRAPAATRACDALGSRCATSSPPTSAIAPWPARCPTSRPDQNPRIGAPEDAGAIGRLPDDGGLTVAKAPGVWRTAWALDSAWPSDRRRSPPVSVCACRLSLGPGGASRGGCVSVRSRRAPRRQLGRGCRR